MIIVLVKNVIEHLLRFIMQTQSSNLTKFNICHLKEYFKLRLSQVEKWKAQNEEPYPHKFHVSSSLEDFINKYEDTIEPGTTLPEVVSVAGM